MKKIFICFLACISVMAFASGKVEDQNTITVLHGGDTIFGETSMFKLAEEKFHKDYPNIKIIWNKLDLSDGSTLTMDAMLAAGTPPNVYTDSMVRASKYMVKEYAYPLNGIRDLKQYNSGVLDQFYRDGNLMALPQPGGAQAICVNMDVLKELNYTIPKNWTIDDYLELAELVKQKYDGKKYITMLFAANQSGDYLLHNWFEVFGAHYYLNGDYDNATIAKTGGEKAYQFYLKLIKNGYVPANAAMVNDDEYALQWYSGNLVATPFFPSWVKPYFKTAKDQGMDNFNYKFVPFPTDGKNGKGVPLYVNGAAWVVYKTGTDIDKVAARLVEYMNDAESQGLFAKYTGTPPNRKDAMYQPTDQGTLDIMEIAKAFGFYDAGVTDPRFTERRALQYPILQDLFNGKINPKEAIELYESKLTAIKK